MQEQMGLFKSDDFLIADTQGKPYFKLDASIWTSHRQLLDIYNNPVLQVIKNQDGISVLGIGALPWYGRDGHGVVLHSSTCRWQVHAD
jgi:hypothetical protein